MSWFKRSKTGIERRHVCPHHAAKVAQDGYGIEYDKERDDRILKNFNSFRVYVRALNKKGKFQFVQIGWYCRHCKLFETDKTTNSGRNRTRNISLRRIEPSIRKLFEEVPTNK